MLTRVLGSALLALLAWLPAERGRTWALRGTARERIAVSVSALDVATDSPARAQRLETLPLRLAPQRKTPPAPTASCGVGAVEIGPAPSRVLQSLASRGTEVRGIRAKRLTIPHDATAPPPRRS